LIPPVTRQQLVCRNPREPTPPSELPHLRLSSTIKSPWIHVGPRIKLIAICMAQLLWWIALLI
jgi:hypothetical protein